MKTAILGLATLSALALGVTARPADGAASGATPRWLGPAETLTLNRTFGGARPVHTTYIGYQRKIAVVWQFEHVVVCRLCSAPSNAQRPRGRVIRLTYDRRTHRQGNAMQFCEVENLRPPLSVCLRH